VGADRGGAGAPAAHLATLEPRLRTHSAPSLRCGPALPRARSAWCYRRPTSPPRTAGGLSTPRARSLRLPGRGSVWHGAPGLRGPAAPLRHRRPPPPYAAHRCTGPALWLRVRRPRPAAGWPPTRLFASLPESSRRHAPPGSTSVPSDPLRPRARLALTLQRVVATRAPVAVGSCAHPTPCRASPPAAATTTDPGWARGAPPGGSPLARAVDPSCVWRAAALPEPSPHGSSTGVRPRRADARVRGVHCGPSRQLCPLSDLEARGRRLTSTGGGRSRAWDPPGGHSGADYRGAPAFTSSHVRGRVP